jgi:hypothetical protein
MGAAFVVVQVRAGWQRPQWSRIRPLMRIGGHIAVRTTALLASFLVASAVLARVGPASLAAHQIAFQLFVFVALVLDALAIAAQVMVGGMLGAGEAAGAREAALRIIGWSVVAGAAFGLVLLKLADVIPRAFTGDEAVVAEAREIWWIFVLMMPANRGHIRTRGRHDLHRATASAAGAMGARIRIRRRRERVTRCRQVLGLRFHAARPFAPPRACSRRARRAAASGTAPVGP